MLYLKRTVKCSAVGISRDEAIASLEASTRFASGFEVLNMKKQANKWVATILEPKVADMPPFMDDNDDDDDNTPKKPKPPGGDSDPDQEAPDPEGDSPPSPDGSGPPDGGPSDGPPKEKGGHKEQAELHELISLVHSIADHLGLSAPGGDGGPMGGGPDGPPGPPMPPPGGPPAGGPDDHQTIVHQRALKPGEAPPGTTPIGTPAFSSVAQNLSRINSFDMLGGDSKTTIKQAKEDLTERFGSFGFKVVQANRRPDGQIAAKLSRRK